MTVRELREALFNLEDQDAEVKLCIFDLDSGSVKHFEIKAIEKYTHGGYYINNSLGNLDPLNHASDCDT